MADDKIVAWLGLADYNCGGVVKRKIGNGILISGMTNPSMVIAWEKKNLTPEDISFQGNDVMITNYNGRYVLNNKSNNNLRCGYTLAKSTEEFIDILPTLAQKIKNAMIWPLSNYKYSNICPSNNPYPLAVIKNGSLSLLLYSSPSCPSFSPSSSTSPSHPDSTFGGQSTLTPSSPSSNSSSSIPFSSTGDLVPASVTETNANNAMGTLVPATGGFNNNYNVTGNGCPCMANTTNASDSSSWIIITIVIIALVIIVAIVLLYYFRSGAGEIEDTEITTDSDLTPDGTILEAQKTGRNISITYK